MQVSNDTVLRVLKKGARPAISKAHVVGVDEWAKCKGRSYGTILVDLERRTVIEVLDQHSTEAVEQWFLAHPEIDMICRDRNGRYAKAARQGAPAANQVADRFHLVQNLREAVERELSVNRAHLRVRLTGNAVAESQLMAPTSDRPAVKLLNPRERRRLPARRLAIQTEIALQNRQSTQELFDKFKALQATGLKISVISRQLGLNRRRFDRWARQNELPERNKMQPRPGLAETFRDYLHRHWQAGYRNGRMLLDEIRALGYIGTYKALGKVVSPWRLGNVEFERSAARAKRLWQRPTK